MGNKRPRDEQSRNLHQHSRKASKTYHDHTTATPHPPTKDLADLDKKYPSKATYAYIPGFDFSTNVLAHSASIPPLPPISDALSKATFTHSSVVDERNTAPNDPDSNYERLEFLGDSYLGIIAVRLIYARFPHLPTGKQSALKEKLVRNATLALFSKFYGFDKRLKINDKTYSRWVEDIASRPASAKHTAEKVEKIYADVFEAYIAAVVLSDDRHGFATAEKWLTQLWIPILLEEDPMMKAVQNRKDELSRMIGGKYIKIEYEEEKPMEIRHDGKIQVYHVAVFLTGWGYTKQRLGGGEGQGKKEAGMRAAADALDNNTEFLEELAATKRVYDEKRRAERQDEPQAEPQATEMSQGKV